jgi:hypothetical protein
MKANPMPVFPLVGSTSVVFPGVIFPSSSAAAIMLHPMRSFTLQHGSIISSFAAISAPHPSDVLFKYTIGVHPTSCVTLSAMFTFPARVVVRVRVFRVVRVVFRVVVVVVVVVVIVIARTIEMAIAAFDPCRGPARRSPNRRGFRQSSLAPRAIARRGASSASSASTIRSTSRTHRRASACANDGIVARETPTRRRPRARTRSTLV